MKGKLLLKSGLAAVATIHATHEVYSSMEKRNARRKAVKEGRLSPEEAKKLKTKALLQDAASVGIAAMGIKGAVSELKEAKHVNAECKTFKEEKVRRHERRLERRKKLDEVNGSRGSDSWAPSSRSHYGGYESDDDYYGYEPSYRDGNPYGAARLPAPHSDHGR